MTPKAVKNLLTPCLHRQAAGASAVAAEAAAAMAAQVELPAPPAAIWSAYIALHLSYVLPLTHSTGVAAAAASSLLILP